jgi:serine/threonine-protein kinase
MSDESPKSGPDLTRSYAAPDPQVPGERFVPGAVLSGRYRIVAPLGRGGMGEVYRADDLTLGQPVALKFLPLHLADDPERLTRFRKEVAAARRVSHPNVCRVYDIADEAGQPFLTMEFVDGEDLDSLLKRVGRLPEEKGVEVARQLCTALAVVHDEGLVHRDLKPANIMLDSRGKVRLTDFGLAAVAAGPSATEARSGTPQYMAPEQLAGRPVTALSDLFSLGLVLYELFTGMKAFPGTDRETSPDKPSDHIAGLDPALERIILRCLKREPNDRPASALAVAAALPGGDPLAAAVAAGETPPPGLVADAGEVGLIKPWVGLALLAVLVIELLVLARLYDYAVFRRVPLPKPPEVLVDRTQDILRKLDCRDAPADTASGFRTDALAVVYAYRIDPAFVRGEPARVGGPAPVYFFYRQGPIPLAPLFNGRGDTLIVSDDNPPPTAPGMAGVTFDPAGHLLSVYAVPPAPDVRSAAAGPVTWEAWFREAGLDLGRFEADPAGPVYHPPVACTERFAWREKLTDAEAGCRVEAGADQGRAVYFRVTGPWHRAARWGEAQAGEEMAWETSERLTTYLWYAVYAVVAILAVRNLWRGRGDVRTVARMGAVIVGLTLAARAAAGWHVPDAFAFAPAALGFGAWVGLITGGSYLAVEPAIRRWWPWRLTGWVRLFAGRVRDPLVGRDVLIGAVCGVLAQLTYTALALASVWLKSPAGFEPASTPAWFTPGTIYGVTGPPAVRLLAVMGLFFRTPFLQLSFAFVLFLLVRREGWAWAMYFLVNVSLNALQNWSDSWVGNGLMLVYGVVLVGLISVLLARFGLLAAATQGATNALMIVSPLTTQPSAWYFWPGTAAAAVLIGVAGLCCYTATGGLRLFKKGFFGDD